ncbi:MAG: beta-propeller domain-containing protein [Eubacterium sp.]|nr:beta-propeller domain-containing protein [Eubacterium sp.]
MDRRDNEIFENDIKSELMNDDIKIPDSIKPESIEKRIALMTPEEMKKRKNSVDVPYQNASGDKESEKKDKNKKIRRVVLPIVLAAALILMFGLGMKVGGRNRIKTADPVLKDEAVTDSMVETDEEVAREESAAENDVDDDEEESEKKSFFEKKTDNYDKAYEALKACSDYAENMIENYSFDLDGAVTTQGGRRTFSATNDAAEDSIGIPQGELKQAEGTPLTQAQSGSSNVVPEFTDTNVRTEGVNESDIVKTDGQYIYSYDYSTEHIRIFKVKDGDMEEVGYINTLSTEISNSEMYISGDRLIYVGWDESYDDGSKLRTAVAIYDIKDRKNPELIKRITQDGTYYSSRLVDDYLYIFSRKSVALDKLSKRKYETFIPEIDGELIGNDKIFVQDDCFVDSYVVISAIDINKGKVKDRLGLLAGSDKLYVSTDNIYLTDRLFRWNIFRYDNDTNIAKISYKNGKLKFGCKGSIQGYIKDDYCIDEYKDHLRVVSTYFDNSEEANGLFVYDENLKKKSVIKGLAPNETIKSARFMGDTAYFVTFRQTDPLFAVDLSDPENPKITDYLKIPGFSEYLHPYSDGRLLGIGYDADENTGRTECLKLTMFDVSDPTDIEELDTMYLDEYSYASVFGNRKALMFDSRDGLFGFGAETSWDIRKNWDLEGDYQIGSFYNIYDYDEEKGFVNKLEYSLSDDDQFYSSADIYDTRGIIIGDYFYLVQDGDKLTSFDTEKFEVKNQLN